MLFHKVKQAQLLSQKAGKLLWLVSIFVLLEGMLWYLLPSYFEGLFGIELAGVIIAAYGVSSVLTNMPIADISDKISRTFTVAMGMVLFIVSLLFLNIVSFPSALLVMFLLGAGSACINAGALHIVLDQAPQMKSAKLSGLYYMFRSIGWAFGSVLGGVLLFFLSFKVVAVVLLLAAVVFYVRFILLYPQKNSFKKVQRSGVLLLKDSIYKGEWKRVRQYGLLIATYMFYSLSFGIYEYAIWIAEPIYTANLGTNIILGALALSFLELPRLFFSKPIGALVDRFGSRIIITLGIGGTLLIHVYYIWFSSQNLLALVFMFVAMAVSDICILLSFNQQLHRYVSRGVRAQAFSAGETFYDFGGIAAPLLVGLVLGTTMDFSALFSVTLGLYLVLATLMMIVLHKDARLFRLAFMPLKKIVAKSGISASERQ